MSEPLSPAAQAVLQAITEISPAPADEIATIALRVAAVYSYCPVDRQRLATIAAELEGQ